MVRADDGPQEHAGGEDRLEAHTEEELCVDHVRMRAEDGEGAEPVGNDEPALAGAGMIGERAEPVHLYIWAKIDLLLRHACGSVVILRILGHIKINKMASFCELLGERNDGVGYPRKFRVEVIRKNCDAHYFYDIERITTCRRSFLRTCVGSK